MVLFSCIQPVFQQISGILVTTWFVTLVMQSPNVDGLPTKQDRIPLGVLESTEYGGKLGGRERWCQSIPLCVVRQITWPGKLL